MIPTPSSPAALARHSGKQVKIVPVDRIRVLNPRVRNKRNFQAIVENISQVGLKRPITVSLRRDQADSGPRYDLVCGQGRLEAFVQLGRTAIPAIIINADESDCLVMSLVENCARRQHRAIDLLEDIATLRKRGYDDQQIAAKIGVTGAWVNMIGGLLERGEQRLIAAVEKGLMPVSLAVEIAKADDEGIQRALTQAYTEKQLKGRKLVAVRRLLEQRRKLGKEVKESPFGRKDGAKRPPTGEMMVRIYRREADRQRILIKKAEVAQSRLLFVVEAMRALRADENFVNLLRAEGLDAMPSYLQERLARGALP